MQANKIVPIPESPGESPRPQKPRCDNYHITKTGSLARCRRRAKYRLTVVDCGEVGALYRCQPCRDELTATVESGEPCTVLEERPIGKDDPFDHQVSAMAVVLIGFNWAGHIMNVTIHQWPDPIIPLNGKTLLRHLADFLAQSSAAEAAQAGKAGRQ